MTIEVKRLSAKIIPKDDKKPQVPSDIPQIEVKVFFNKGTPNEIQTWDGTLSTKTGTNEGEMGDGYIWLQSHWGSGVKFTDITITPR